MWFPTHLRGQEILWCRLNCVPIELIIYMPQVLHHRHHRQLEQTTHILSSGSRSRMRDTQRQNTRQQDKEMGRRK